jgi:membrane protein YdbS with pleckstrin-like domain
MLNKPKILGISMAPQKNRRLLLTVVYAVLLACAAVIIVPSWAARIPPSDVLLFSVTVYVLIEIRVFPKLLKVEEFGERSGAMIVHGMKPGSPEMEEIDEREMAVRNLAHLRAFRVIKLYVVLIAITLLVWHEASPSTIFRFAAIALLLLALLTFTLPQAIILWTEPDVLEESRVSS